MHRSYSGKWLVRLLGVAGGMYASLAMWDAVDRRGFRFGLVPSALVLRVVEQNRTALVEGRWYGSAVSYCGGMGGVVGKGGLGFEIAFLAGGGASRAQVDLWIQLTGGRRVEILRHRWVPNIVVWDMHTDLYPIGVISWLPEGEYLVGIEDHISNARGSRLVRIEDIDREFVEVIVRGSGRDGGPGKVEINVVDSSAVSGVL